jgi:predicted P-loop ATPase
LNKRNLNGISCAALNNGIDCWDKDIKRYVESDNVKEYNPFTLYFDNLPKWDGKDRVTPLAGRVCEEKPWVNGFHRWMLAMTAVWMRFGDGKAANSVVPILVSRKQGLGKSTFCRMLMPTELQRYFTESYDLSSVSAAENKLSNFGLINLDEFDKLSKKKMPLLKNLIQMESLNTRRAYQQFNEPVSRLASFIGTSNRYDLLTDTTGSRRFICVDVKQKIDSSPIEYAQLYAQLKAELESGMRYWFSKREEREIQHHNKAFYAHGIEEDVFSSCFRFATADDENNKDVKVFTLSATEIYEKMKKHHPAAMRGVTSDKVSRMLPGLGRRIHTRYGNGYRIVER